MCGNKSALDMCGNKSALKALEAKTTLEARSERRSSAKLASDYYSMASILLFYELRQMCPHTPIHVSAYDYICVRISVYLCPLTTMYASAY
jgi:hypothetical protein